MADVARTAAGVGEQLTIVAGLRWQMFRNSLRTTSGRFDLLARTALGAGTAVIAAGIGAGLGVASYLCVARGSWRLLALPLWAVFLTWQVMPLLLAASGSSFDSRSLLRYPLRFSVFFLLSLVSAGFDPPVAAALLWLVCIAAAIVLARPDLLGSTLLVVTLFALMNLLLNGAVFSWLERWMARRRTREALLAILLLGFLSLQLAVALEARLGKRLAPFLNAVLPALQFLPPSLASKAVAGAARGQPSSVVSSAGLLAAYALALGLLLGRRLRAQYFGEDAGETQAPAIPEARQPGTLRAEVSRRMAWRWPGISSAAAAVFEKEFRYLFRNTATLLLLVLPLILTAFFMLAWGAPRERSGLLSRSPDLAFPAAVAYMFLIVSQLAYNSFAYEGRGVQLLFVAPIRFRDVLLGKNLMLGLLLAAESAAVWVVMGFLFRPPGAMMVLTTYAALLFSTLMQCLVGNWLSIRFPRRMEFGQTRRRVAGVTALIGIGLQVVLIALPAGFYLLARLIGRPWLVPAVFLGLSAAALRVYVATLDYFSRFAAEKREVLTAELSR